jgi:Concanavalin A-like lectin/glucanases superfamily
LLGKYLLTKLKQQTMKKITTLFTTLVLFTHVFSQTTTGMVAYFPLNGNITDAGPNGISGTNFGGTATTNNAGTANSAMNFANVPAPVAQYATHVTNANTSFAATQNFTIAFACNINSIPHPGGLYDNNLNYGGPGVWLWNANGFPQINFNFKNGNIGTTNGALTLNTWKHIAAVHNGTNISIYINGVLNVSGAESTTAPVYSFPARIGSMFFNGFTPPQYNGLNGKLDELRIYNRALTVAEILLLSQRALPIKLTSFTATQKNNDVTIQWQTAQEANTKQFNVQRSADGINFTTLSVVAAKGNTVNNTNYTYTDNTIATLVNTAVVYYRLQSVDFDGKTQYSPVVTVSLLSKSSNVVVLQNPVKNNMALQITLQQQQQVIITVANSIGQQVNTIQQVLPSGKTTLTIPTTTFTKGIYYVTVHYKNTKQTLPILKE